MKTKIWAHSSRSCLHTFRRLAGTSLQTVHNIAQPVTHTYTHTSTAADNQLCCCATSMRRVYLPKLVCAWVNVCACYMCVCLFWANEILLQAVGDQKSSFSFLTLFFLVLIFDIFSLAAKQQTNWQTAGRFHRCNWVNMEGSKSAMQMQGQNR